MIDQNTVGEWSDLNEEAKQTFLNQVASSRRSTNEKRGNVQVFLDDQWYFVSIKQCTGSTVNQVRAIRYVPLVIYAKNTQSWFVIPPQVVVFLMLNKRRGQHTEISFESNTLSLRDIPERFRCSQQELEQAVIDAIRQGEESGEIRAVMEGLRNQLASLNNSTKSQLQALAG